MKNFVRAFSLRRKKPVLREPRKKIEIRLNKIHQEFIKELEKLESFVATTDDDYAREMGTILLNDATFLEDCQIFPAVIDRFASLSDPLLDPDDISLWLLYHYQDFLVKVRAFFDLFGGEDA